MRTIPRAAQAGARAGGRTRVRAGGRAAAQPVAAVLRALPALPVLLALLAPLVLLALLGGCATHDGGTPGALSRALQEAASAAATGALVVQQAADGDATQAVLDSALADAIADARAAETAVDWRQVYGPDDAASQDAAMAAIGEAQAALVAARAWSTGAVDDPAAAVAGRLQASADHLAAMAEDLG